VGAEVVIAVVAVALALNIVMTRFKHSVGAEIILLAVVEASTEIKMIREASEVAEEVIVVGQALVEFRAMMKHRLSVGVDEEISEVVGEALVEIRVMMKQRAIEVKGVALEAAKEVLAVTKVMM